MALPKKISRKIVVNEICYRWAALSTDTVDPSWEERGLDVTLIIEIDAKINTRICDRISLPGLTGFVWQVDQQDSFVHPRHVSAVVKAALDDGWKPDLCIDYDSDVLFRLVVMEYPPDVANRLLNHRSSRPASKRTID